MKKIVSLVLMEHKQMVIIVGIDFIKTEYRQRLKIKGSQFHNLSQNVAWHSYVKRQDVCSFVFLITDYVERSDAKIVLDKNIQKIVSDCKNKKTTKINNIKVAKIIKSLKNNSNFKDNFNLNLLKKNIKQQISADYNYYFKILDNIFETIKKTMVSKYKLYSLQEESIYHHIILGSACNFSVPGAGKTLISLMVFYFLKNQNKVDKLLLIGPLGSYISWVDEYLKFIKNSSKQDILRFDKTSCEENDWFFLSNPKQHIIFINYEKIYQNKNLLIKFLKENDVFVVFDEVHKIKNFNSKRTQSAREIFDYCENKLLLTGTPMPKGYEDLVTYFEAMPLINLGDIDFLNKSSLELQKMTKQSLLYSDEIQKIQEQTDVFYTRISKKDLNLGKSKIIFWINFKNDKKHQEIYEIIEKKLINVLKSYKDKKKLTEILKVRILRLMQASIDPRMIKIIGNEDDNFIQDQKYNDNDVAVFSENYRILRDNPEPENEKSQLTYSSVPLRYNFCFQKVDALFKEKKIKKIIIWSCWIYAINELFEFFSKKNYVTQKVYGNIDLTERDNYFHDFQKIDGEIQVLICNPASVSESVSLHQHCYDAVYFDMTWNALYYMQSKERIHRYKGGEKTNVNYYILVHKGSIDDKVWNNIRNKENRMLKMIENKELKPIDDSPNHLLNDIFNDYIKDNKNP